MAAVHALHRNAGYMTSPDQGTAAFSRLQQMQARFQEKQRQEKEQKLLTLYADQARQAYARINNAGGGGKVRQLFQGRRGLDRSYPLRPLERSRGTSLDRGRQLHQQNAANTTRITGKVEDRIRAAPPRYPSAGYEGDNDDEYHINRYHRGPPFFGSQPRLDQQQDQLRDFPTDIVVGKADPHHQQQALALADGIDYLSKSHDLDSTKIFKRLPNIGGANLAPDEQKTNNTIMMAPAKEQESSAALKKPTPASTNPKVNRTSNSSTDVGVKSLTKTMAKLTPPSKKVEVKSVQNPETKPKVGAQRRPTPVPVTSSSSHNGIVSRPSSNSSTEKQKPKTVPVKMAARNAPLSSKSSQRSKPPLGGAAGSQADLSPCSICGRNFASDRLPAHQNICAKTTQKKRKPFDPMKQRLTGTGAEKYLRKGKPAPPPINLKKSNWRKKHEEFINNIRAAKEAQAHVAAGGKLSDLPPPPPLDTSDYTPCPHCGRKFNDAAAARHIPKCATMMHNKPKPSAPNNRLQAAKKRY